MTQPATISADYTLRPSELAATLALLVEARQPAMVWGPPGSAKSMIAQQVAADGGREYVDVRALLLDPVDLRGIPWRDAADRTRWAPPVFLPPTDDTGLWLINLEELPSCVPMVQAALYQLALERKVGEYELPEGASLIACGNREGDRGVVHRMPTPLASRFVHLEIRVDAEDWLVWGAANGIAPEVLFFVQLEPTLLHQFDPQSKEKAFPCPRTWESFLRRLGVEGVQQLRPHRHEEKDFRSDSIRRTPGAPVYRIDPDLQMDEARGQRRRHAVDDATVPFAVAAGDQRGAFGGVRTRRTCGRARAGTGRPAPSAGPRAVPPD